MSSIKEETGVTTVIILPSVYIRAGMFVLVYVGVCR